VIWDADSWGARFSRRIFGRHFRADSTDFGIVREVLGRISKLVVDSSAGETVDRDWSLARKCTSSGRSATRRGFPCLQLRSESLWKSLESTVALFARPSREFATGGIGTAMTVITV